MINPVILPLCGPIAIHWYGAMIALGVLIFIYCTEQLLIKKRLLTSAEYHTFLMSSVIAGALGGKLVYLLTEESVTSWLDILKFFEGGFSILGTVLGIALTVPLVMHYLKKPLWPISDICVSFIPLTQAFGRIGCFIAGCCFGVPANVPWAVTYHHPHNLAPLGIALHPTQLYSALILLMIFAFLQYARRQPLTPGTVSMLYLILIAAERFVVDFWRAERVVGWWLFSWYQLMALAIMLVASMGLSIIRRRS